MSDMQQSQSNRSENQQNRPGSQGGYGAQGGAGPSAGESSNFQAGELAGQGADVGEPPYLYGQPNNGNSTADGY